MKKVITAVLLAGLAVAFVAGCSSTVTMGTNKVMTFNSQTNLVPSVEK
jgi:outer membrane murein-binding lipoprotein Lpp